jgi:RNA polymerase sigma factor (sigma-70 family)
LEQLNSKILTRTIEQAKKGKERALHSLYGQYSAAMFNVCVRMCSSREDAEDVLQESFVAAFQSLETYSKEATFGAWLKSIVVHRCINSLTRKKENWILSDEEISVSDEEVDFSDINLKVERVNDAIMSLPDGYRVISTLYLLEGYDHQEIASILGITVSTSKSQYMRAKRKIRESLINI